MIKNAKNEVYEQYQTDHTEEREIFLKTTKEKLDLCDKFINIGNGFFDEGQYYRAAGQYRLSEIYCYYIFPDTDEENKRFNISFNLIIIS